MNLYRQFKHTVFSVILFWVLTLPSILQIAHAFDDHKHTICTEVTTHLHESTLDCSLCDFNFSTFNFDFGNPTLLEDPIVYSPHSLTYIATKKVGNSSSFYLRGPPVFT